MSQDKMPPRQNATRQNVTGPNVEETKCHRTIRNIDKMPQDKTSPRQNTTG